MFENIISESWQVVLSHAKAIAKDYWEKKNGSAVLISHSWHLAKALTLSQSSVIVFGEELLHLPRHMRADGMTCQPESLWAVKDAGYLVFFGGQQAPSFWKAQLPKKPLLDGRLLEAEQQ